MRRPPVSSSHRSSHISDWQAKRCFMLGKHQGAQIAFASGGAIEPFSQKFLCSIATVRASLFW